MRIVTPERLTPQQLQEAERLFGRGPTGWQSFSNWEDRRRIVTHYVMTHPATIRLSLGLYALARDVNPIFFSFERGWQVVQGKELFTEQDISRLGAATEFFTALAVGMATNKVMGAVRPASLEGVRPSSEPPRGLQRVAEPPAATGNVIPLERARAARSAAHETQSGPALEAPLASTGTDGPLPRRQGGANRDPTVTRGQRPSNTPEPTSSAAPEAVASTTGDEAIVQSGQLHHVISRRIARELADHPTLRGLYVERDPRFVTRAADKPSHNGYQQWHRDIDKEVTDWLVDHRKATPEEFETLLREIYNRPSRRARFPDGF